MEIDEKLSDINIPTAILRKLEELEIKSVRQLYARLKREGRSLQDYLQLSDGDFSGLYAKVENVVREEYPEDMLTRIHPPVNKTGVAVNRLHEPRPKFNTRG